MQLLLRRYQTHDFLRRLRFGLWAKFELTPDEQTLIEKYQPHKAVLDPGDPKKSGSKWRRALIIGGILAAIISCIALYRANNPEQALIALVVSWIVLTLIIHHQIRETILVGDILTGRHFKSRDVTTLINTEDTMRQMAVVFRRFLEAMKTWGTSEAQEVIPVEIGQMPPLRVGDQP